MKKKEVVTEKLEVVLEGFFLKKLPALPLKVKEFIVKAMPWFILAVLALTVKMILTVWGMRGVVMSGYGGYGMRYGYAVGGILSFVSMVLVLLALPGLFKRSRSSWKLMFYSSLVMVLDYLISLQLGSLIIGSGISLYVLFQVKSLYK